ncbi:GNAT family N-acetyltransferase [Streptomyces sp. NPDC056524]|uniref:GNAT family N-acetyltransferase n=1 Tax=Streptomyces sp. NPDC056524 TaxID=3345851 RepID=UPI00368FA2DD
MTLVRPARPDELPALVEHPGDPERNAATRAYLTQLLDSACTRPEWWELGYDADGTVAVISLPAENPGFPVIGFVGVAPAHRGKGYATSVVIRGTRVLVAAGAREIRGDCDAANVAMAKAFERAGYVNFADRLEFARAL